MLKKRGFRLLISFVFVMTMIVSTMHISYTEQNNQDESFEKLNNITEDIKDMEQIETVNFTDKVSETIYKNPTDDTFETIVGKYSLKNILTNYNIFSFNDVQSKHIVGPVIAKNKAYATYEYGNHETSNEQLIVSDYSKSIPSYIGIIDKIKNENKSTVALNYGFDFNHNINFKSPNLYINLSNNDIKKEVGTEEIYYVVSNGENYKSPNNGGRSPILQNDKFLDFEKVKNSIVKESSNLLSNKYNVEISLKEQTNPKKYEIEADTGYLELDAGGNYLIKDASRLRVVDIKYPQGYDPITKPYPYNTVINISGNKLVKSGESFKSKNVTTQGKPDYYINEKTYGKIDNKDHFFFPMVLVNGEKFNGTKPGEGGEYSDNGNSVVWNMPNIETNDNENRVTMHSETDILGHIVAPNAEFWNYREDAGKVTWNGGNNNGCAIVKSWHGGYMESHMWPYGEGEIGEPIDPDVDIFIKGKKEIQGFSESEIYMKDFKFKLDMFEGEEVPEGILSKNIPQTVTQKDGNIEFLPITFNKEGIYYFRIKEVIPEDNDDVVYDKSEYKVCITVNKDIDNSFKTSITITKIIDKDGIIINTSENAEEIVFVNKKEEIVKPEKLRFTIEKRDEITNTLLKDAEFSLYKSDKDGNPQDEPILTNIITNENGKITVENESLKYNQLYVLIETKAPEGYINGENIVFYIKDKKETYLDIHDIVIIDNEGIIKVLNKQSDELLPETGGYGNNIYYLIGTIIILASLMVSIFKI